MVGGGGGGLLRFLHVELYQEPIPGYMLYMITAHGTVSFLFTTFSCNNRVVVLSKQ